MGKGKIKLLSTVPGAQNLASIVRHFCNREGGIVTSFSDTMIRPLAQMVPEDSDAEVMPFGALARRFATFCGELPLPVAHEGHVVAAIAAACEELEEASPFHASARFPGLHRSIVSTMHELAAWNFDPDRLEACAPRVSSRLGSKLKSLAQLECEAAETLRQAGRGLSRDNFRLCEEASPEPGAELGRVLVVAGNEAPPNALNLLKWAIGQGCRVTLVVYRHPGRAELFASTAKILEYFEAAPEEVGTSSPLLGTLFTADQAVACTPRCTVAIAPDPLSECEWALRGCLERKAEGHGFDSMAIFVRDTSSYAPLLESAAKRLNVPLRLNRRSALMTNSFARLTLSALEFCIGRDVRTLIPLARTTYVGLSREQFLRVEAASKSAHADRGRCWEALEEWAIDQEDFGWLIKLLQWRRKALANPLPLEGWIGELRNLMGELPWESNPAGRARDVRAQAVLWRSLANEASVRRLRGERSYTLPQFVGRARRVWLDSDVSIPAGEMGIFVTGDAGQLPACRSLFVLGMLEGVFPRRRSEDPILTDAERMELSKVAGGAPLPTSRDRADAERDEFYLVCSSASQELVFSYPQTDEERDNVPAFYLEEISRANPGTVSVAYRRNQWAPEVPIAGSDAALRAALQQERVYPEPLQLKPDTVLRLNTDPGQPRSPRQLREALQCPFNHFARHILQVQPERLRTRWFSLIALPGVAGLLRQPSREQAESAMADALETQLDQLIGELPEWEIGLLRSGGKRLISEWVSREFTSRALWKREDTSSGVRFGDVGLRDDMKQCRLAGRVAGLSKLGPYNVVHLLESSAPQIENAGESRLSPPDTLYYGLHLMAAWERGRFTAVEVESMSGERVLMTLPRLPNVSLASRVQDGLKLIDLGDGYEGQATERFFNEVKGALEEANERIRSFSIFAVKGDHCKWCDYGELCRSGSEFQDQESPFV